MVTAASLLVLGISPALAGDTEMAGEAEMEDVDDEDTESYQKMLQLSAEGNELYEQGDLEQAAETYSRAYDAYPQPILLKNEMITRYLLEECETAVELGTSFMDADAGSEEDRQDVEAVLGECSLELAEEALADDELSRVAHWLDFGESYWVDEDLRADGQELRAQLDERIEDDEVEEPVVDEPPESDFGTRQIGGLSLTGAGAVALGSALVWHLRWESRHSDLEAMRDEVEAGEMSSEDFADEQSAVQDSYDTVRWAVPTLYGLGAVATAAGLTMLLWPSSNGEEPAAMVHPVWTGDGAGAGVSLRF